MTRKLPREANLCLEKHLRELKIKFSPEFPFEPKRKWRFDYILCDFDGYNLRIAIEIEGGIWSRGRHTRGKGFLNDMEKYNHAAMLGYRVIRFATQQCLDGSAKAFLKSWLS